MSTRSTSSTVPAVGSVRIDRRDVHEDAARKPESDGTGDVRGYRDDVHGGQQGTPCTGS